MFTLETVLPKEKKNMESVKRGINKINFIAIKLPILIVAGMLITLFATAQITYCRFEDQMVKACDQVSKGITNLMINEYPVEYTAELLREGFKSQKYNETIKEMYKLKDGFDEVLYMYFWVCTEDGGVIIMDLDEEYTKVPLTESVLAVGTLYPYGELPKEQIDQVAYGKGGFATYTEIDDEGRHIYSAAAPIFDEDGNYVCSACIDMSMDEVRKNNIDFIYKVFIFCILFMIPIWSIIMFIIHKDIVSPMEKMVNCILNLKRNSEIDKFAGLAKFEDLNINTKNELEIFYRASLIIAKENLFNASNCDRTKNQLEEVSKIAYKDSLTGVGTKKGYEEKVESVQKKLNNKEDIEFAIAMVDINNLKRINDVYGHEKGDSYIKGCCSMVCNVFKHSPVYRIGGDEFIIFLEGEDFINKFKLKDQIKEDFKKSFNNEEVPEYERYTASIGLAVYSSRKDKNVNDVFKRADERMYNSKEQFKERYGSYR